jgi:hypothetical protein
MVKAFPIYSKMILQTQFYLQQEVHRGGPGGEVEHISVSCLDLEASASQTRIMAHIYMRFDFGSDEDRAQQARHKLEVWKQAFRLDKKLLYKFDRGGNASAGAAQKAGEAKAKGKDQAAGAEPVASGSVKLLLRLAFSGHEKLSEHRWVERIPGEELFKEAAPHLIKPGEAEFEATEAKFENLE